ncbi:MBL fold metallo-hydrolase [Amycolatopsis lurida]
MGPDSGELTEIADGVHAYVQPDGTWWVNNAGVIAGDGGTFVVDTCATAERTRRFLDLAAEATGTRTPRWAVNTHQHGDHSYGNSLLPESTVLIGHEAMRAALAVDPLIEYCPPVWEPRPDWGPVTRRLPDLTMTTDLVVHNGNRRIELHHPGYQAHTGGDVVVWLPHEKVLFTGDLVFNGLTPMMGMGSCEGGLLSLEWLASFRAEHLVPGHGPLMRAEDVPEVFEQLSAYYRLVLDTAAAGRRDGLTPLDAARRCDLGEFADWADSERLVLNLHREYAIAAESEVDLVAAFADAVTYHGGPLPTTV